MSDGEAQPRILFVDQSGELGGAELFLLEVLETGAFRGRVVVLKDGPFRGRLQAAGVEVFLLEQQFSSARGSGVGSAILDVWPMLAAGWKLGRQARDFDLIYANTQKALVVSVLASVLARKPVVWHLHDILTSAHFSATMRRLSVALANWRARLVIANSRATEESFRATGGKTRSVVVYNGFDSSRFGRDGSTARAALDAMLPGPGPLIGVFGRLAEWKGQHIVLEAMSAVAGVRAAFVGGALFGEDAYEARLRSDVRRLGLEDRVRLLGFRQDVAELMSAVDVVVHSSIAPEPFGRVVVEAMLAGRPIVASAAGGVPEIVDDRQTGILVPPRNPAAMGAAIAELVNNQELARALGSAARRRATERFTLEQAVAGLRRAIDLVLRNNPKIPWH